MGTVRYQLSFSLSVVWCASHGRFCLPQRARKLQVGFFCNRSVVGRDVMCVVCLVECIYSLLYQLPQRKQLDSFLRLHLDGVNTQKKGVGALMILLQPYVVRQFYLPQIHVTVVQDLARGHYRTCGARNKSRSGMLYRRYRTGVR